MCYVYSAKDFGINVIFGGHNATETLGIKALLAIIKNTFKDIEVEFLDAPTGL
ncbi:MAG: hypothetical protein WA432_01805 [Candidatus Babeliaceae bacterium]